MLSSEVITNLKIGESYENSKIKITLEDINQKDEKNYNSVVANFKIISSNGKINLQLNFLRSKNLHKQVLDDMVIKFESNFLREYDEDSYPSDSYEPIEDLICTHNQLETFMRTIEGCTYRLKQ